MIVGTLSANTFVSVEIIELNTFRFTTQSDSATYYILEASPDLFDYEPLAIDFSSSAPIWEVDTTLASGYREFYRLEQVSLYAPHDSDGDRIDDIYELNHPDILDPTNPLDAYLDPDHNGKTHLQEYLELFDFGDAPQFYAREISIYNYGSPTDAFEAISREYTSYNLGSPSAAFEANSRMLSVYNGSGAPLIAGYPVVHSRILSTYNLGAPTAEAEAISRLFSVYNGSGTPIIAGIPQVYSREVSAYNYGSPTATIEAISRIISVNALKPTE